MMSSKSADLNKRHELAITRGAERRGSRAGGACDEFIRIFVSLRTLLRRRGR